MLKKTLSILLSLCILFGVLTILPLSAYAKDTDIAEEGADVDLSYTGADDYPYANYAMEGYDPWRFVYRNCTSFVAWRLNSRNGVDFNNWYGGVEWGWAGNWGNAAQSLGITVDNTPAVGAVAWQSSGHVAWVSEVYSDGSFYIEEYNWNGDGKYHSRQRNTWDYTGFIHIKDLNGAKTGLDYGDEFYAVITTNTSDVVVGQNETDNYNSQLVSNSIAQNCVFHFKKVNSNNGYRIRSSANNRYLDVAGGNDADDTNVWFCGYNDHPAQVWYIQDKNIGGNVSLTAGCTSRYLNAVGSQISIGTNLQMNTWWGAEGQKFGIWKVGDNVKCGLDYGSDFYAMIKNGSSMKPIGRVDIGKTDTENIVLMTESKNNYDRTIWHFTRLNGLNAYRISNLTDDLFMDVDGAIDSDGTNIQAYKYHDHPAQEWYLQTRKGALALTAGCVNRYLDVTGASTADGANLELWEYHGNNDAQKFSLEIIDSTSVINYAISTNKSKYDLGDSVTATISGTLPYVYNYKFHIVKPDGTKEVIDNQCNSVLNYKPAADGVYTIFAEVKNPLYTDTGSVINKSVSFRVGEEPTEPPTEAEKRYLGDVDDDGEVGVIDATYIQRYDARFTIPISDEDILARGDVDGDEEVTVLDATYIQRYDAGFDTPYPIGEMI